MAVAKKQPSFRLRAQVRSEKSEGELFIRWCRKAEAIYPELSEIYHIPNGGARDIQTGAQLKREGVKAGMPDYCLPCQRGGFGALYLEMKILEGGKLSEVQRLKHIRLRANGNMVVVCAGWEKARKAVLEYLELPH